MRRRFRPQRYARPSRRVGGVRGQAGSALHKVAYAVVAIVLVGAVAVQQDWIPGLGPDQTASPPADRSEPPASGPGLQLAQPAAAPAVLDPAPTRTRVRPAVVQDLLDRAVKDKDLGKHLGLTVERLGSGTPLMTVGGRSATVTPASTLKLLTCTAALHLMGADHRFATTVVSGPTRRSIVLVGGGDPLLTAATPTPAQADTSYPDRASLQQLARSTAAALRKKGIGKVALTYDVSLYSGPAVSPAWEKTYVADNVVSPIVPLWVDEGRAVDGYAARVADPAADAARRFETFLDHAGVKVTGQADAGKARPSAQPLASVESAPLDEIVQHILEVSDNEGAETLLRQAAVAAGRPGSFTAGVGVVQRQLAGLGLDLAGVKMHDGSGLSRQDHLPVGVIAGVLQLAAAPQHPELRTVVSTLPVAGFTGSLAYRFVDDAPSGLGMVRAKTGTLSGVHGLAGLVTTRRGTPLVFVAVADRVPLVKTLAARAQLDRIAALLASCPC